MDTWSISDSPRSRVFAPWVAHRHGGSLLFVLGFVAIAAIVRVTLLVASLGEVSWDASLAAAFGWGLLYDLGAGLLASLPVTLILTCLPGSWFVRQWQRVLAHAAGLALTFGLLFCAVAEWVFWDEFSARFNFIAVDYLVYTQEVTRNIRESYPLPLIFSGMLLGALTVYWLGLKTRLPSLWLAAPPQSARRRWLAGTLWTLAAVIAGLTLDSDQLPGFANSYNRELAKNGVWSFFAAFRDNELGYDQFYPTLPLDDAFRFLHTELAADGAVPLTSELHDTLRWVHRPGPEIHPNVIQITVESLSASFLGAYNPNSNLTPNLDALVPQSLVFDHCYATGTRTDRGMEALTLSLPPTPGRSLIKRPRNEGLFTLGSVFRSRGYDTAFIYGGYGYFDNMNYFFANNGYRVVDRAAVGEGDITFANAWGACDEDLYRWTLREADVAHAAGKPFHFFVMTTSNHRPYTYPAGRIDLPPKVSGRNGAVKYTDYAIGKFLRDASAKPWFKNTVFVIVADHCASVAGKTDLPVEKYHIPLLIYAPGGQIAAGRVTDLMSQIDYPPTLLGLFQWSYASRFFGWDVRQARGDRRALIGNYQNLGLFEPGWLGVLKPLRVFTAYRHDPITFSLTPQAIAENYVNETIAYYQTASNLYKTGRYRALSVADQTRYARLQPATAAAGPESWPVD